MALPGGHVVQDRRAVTQSKRDDPLVAAVGVIFHFGICCAGQHQISMWWHHTDLRADSKALTLEHDPQLSLPHTNVEGRRTCTSTQWVER
jgi:hypothetical protein